MQGEPHKALWKSERRSTEKKRARQKKKLSRRQCREVVYRREKWRCQRCKRAVTLDCWPHEDQFAQVNDIVPRSLGGDPLDPANQELICLKCHFSGPSGAHAPTPERMKRDV